jgi:small GTP-binding protein
MLQKLSTTGFRLKLMVVGESGLGKTTLIDTLFRSNIKEASAAQGTSLNAKTVSIEKREVSINENGVKLNLTVIDTPGYGDAINNEDGAFSDCRMVFICISLTILFLQRGNRSSTTLMWSLRIT